MDRGAWWATIHGSQRVGQDWVTEHTHMCSAHQKRSNIETLLQDKYSYSISNIVWYSQCLSLSWLIIPYFLCHLFSSLCFFLTSIVISSLYKYFGLCLECISYSPDIERVQPVFNINLIVNLYLSSWRYCCFNGLTYTAKKSAICLVICPLFDLL